MSETKRNLNTRKKIWLYIPFAILLAINVIDSWLAIRIMQGMQTVNSVNHPLAYQYWCFVNKQLFNIAEYLNLDWTITGWSFYFLAPFIAVMCIFSLAALTTNSFRSYKLTKRSIVVLGSAIITIVLTVLTKALGLSSVYQQPFANIGYTVMWFLVGFMSTYTITSFGFRALIFFLGNERKQYAVYLVSILQNMFLLPFMLAIASEAQASLQWFYIVTAVFAVIVYLAKRIVTVAKHKKRKAQKAETVAESESDDNTGDEEESGQTTEDDSTDSN